MRMDYLPGLTFEEACTLFQEMCGHVNSGDYSGTFRFPSDDCGTECTGNPNRAEVSAYDVHVSDWLSLYDAERVT